RVLNGHDAVSDEERGLKSSVPNGNGVALDEGKAVRSLATNGPDSVLDEEKGVRRFVPNGVAERDLENQAPDDSDFNLDKQLFSVYQEIEEECSGILAFSKYFSRLFCGLKYSRIVGG